MTLIGEDQKNASTSAAHAPQSALELADACLQAAAKDVWGTMLGWDMPSLPGLLVTGRPAAFSMMEVNGFVGFAGKITGGIFFSCPESLAAKMAGAILGDATAVGSREVSEVVGELTNMLAGGCVSRLRDRGYQLAMSIPNIIRGVAIQATSRDVTFMIQRKYVVAGQSDQPQITLIGKFE